MLVYFNFLSVKQSIYECSSWLYHRKIQQFILDPHLSKTVSENSDTLSHVQTLIGCSHSRNPWDMTKERNIIITVFIQACCAAPVIVYYILIPQFLFFAIVRYFFTFIEDVKTVIKKFDSKCLNIKTKFIEMINLHDQSLE